MNNKIFPIFVNFNSGKQLYEGVNAVLKSPIVEKVVVVDNGSVDTSLDYLKKIKKQNRIIILRNKKNLGFYKALNIAISTCLKFKAKRVMPLDFDLDFGSDFITQMSKVRGDVVVPVLKAKMGKHLVYDYGGRINLVTGTQKHLELKKPLEKNVSIQATRDRKQPYWINYVSGGCTIINLDVIKKIGYFDEDYFVYWGDADYALKAMENGFKVVVDTKTIVHHRYEISRQTLNYKKLSISFFDNFTFIRKRIKWYFMPLAYFSLLLVVLNVSIVVLKNILLQTLKS